MRVAGVQLAATDDSAHNLRMVTEYVDRAADAGARLVVFPEATMSRFGSDLLAASQPTDGAWADGVRAAAARRDVVVAVGMFTPASAGRVFNTLLVTGAGVDAAYRKIHLFDAFGFAESDVVAAGGSIVTVDIDGVRIGLSVCYDLRFGELYRALARDGAQVMLVPASWARGAGKETQWETLLRARAIETLSWVLGVDQAYGSAPDGTPQGVGHSVLIDPRGEIRAGLGGAEGLLLGDIDVDEVAAVRRAVPALEHRRPDLFGG